MNNQKNFDLVIIGAGANGSSIALEASKRGLKVALLDAGDIASGSSCRSTKLLHGGVRYLELAFKKFDLSQLNLVKEALNERGYWIKKAPFLAHQLELAIPSENCFSKAYFGSGLRVYDYLSGDKGIANSRTLSSKDMGQFFPKLKTYSHGGVAYSDGQFNDARLNLLMALTAEKLGALILNHCKVIDFAYTKEGKLKGVVTSDLNGVNQFIGARLVVNATGIYSDHIRNKVDQNVNSRIVISRGVHIVTAENLCPLNKGILLPSTDDGRVLFILPFYGKTLIGTTDIQCSIQEAKSPSKEEEDYLLNHVKRLFPNLTNYHFTSSWAGGRPLLKPKNSRTSSQIVREHEIEILPCGLISAMGGKWTTCRKIALDTINAIETELGQSLPDPKEIDLIGSQNNASMTKQLLQKQSFALRDKLPTTDLIEKQIVHLQSKYGLEALKIVGKSTLKQLEPLSPIMPICTAEIIQDIAHEHAKTPTDILARRNRLAMVDIKEAERILPIVQNLLAERTYSTEAIDLEK